MNNPAATPITIIGAGAAGISAARVAADAGIDVTLIDENPHPGGQYYHQSPPEFHFAHPSDAHSGRADGAAVLDLLSHPRIQLLSNTQVWGVFDHNTLGLVDPDHSYFLPVEQVILATGAYDRPMAFPGWTLPGIMGAGAAMRMLKTQWVLPGRRVLLAGLGPLQLALANALIKAGAEVVCVADAANPLKSISQLPKFWGHWDRIGEAVTYSSRLAAHRVPVLFNHAIVSAAGKDHVETAVIARLDKTGAPIPGTEREFTVDAVCLGYGLLPSLSVAASFGCELRFDQLLGWFVPVHDPSMQTTRPTVWIAGDAAGIAGAKAAMVEGKIAALSAAHQLGKIDRPALERQLAPAAARLRHLNRLAGALQTIYAYRPGLAKLAQDDTPLCRCEEVTLGEVKAAIARGATDLHQVKLATRAGMGYCQGRFCSVLIAPLIAGALGRPVSEMTPFTARPPHSPVPLKYLAVSSEKAVI